MPSPTSQNAGGGIMTKKTLFIILGVIGVMILGGLMLALSRNNSGEIMQRLHVRHQNLVAVVEDGKLNIRNEALSNANSELGIILDSDGATLKDAMTAAGLKKIDKNIAALEADDTVEQLSSAKLNGTYDRDVKEALLEHITSVTEAMSALHGETKSAELREALTTEYNNLQTITERIEKIQL